MVAFKARTGEIDPVENNYLSPIDGIYLADSTQVFTLLDTTTDGSSLDPAAPAGSKITALGIEREGFRGRYLALTATMVDPVSTEGMAGIYLSRMLTPRTKSNLVAGIYSGNLDPVPSNLSKVPPVTRISLTKRGVFLGRVVVNGTSRGVIGRLNSNGEALVNIRIGRTLRQLKLVACNVSGVEALDVTVIGGELNSTGLLVQAR